MLIRDTFQTRIEEKIEPVIKVGDRQDQSKLAAEIGRFVVTPRSGSISMTFWSTTRTLCERAPLKSASGFPATSDPANPTSARLQRCWWRTLSSTALRRQSDLKGAFLLAAIAAPRDS